MTTDGLKRARSGFAGERGVVRLYSAPLFERRLQALDEHLREVIRLIERPIAL